MTTFIQETYSIANTGLSELEASVESGKTMQSDLAQAHYLGAWVTTSLKTKRFDSSVVLTLKKLQGRARSLGKKANLKGLLTLVKETYEKLLADDQNLKEVTYEQLDELIQKVEKLNWVVTTNLDVGERLNHHTEGKNSLLICPTDLEEGFNDDDYLIKPISLYVRGEQSEIIKLALAEDLLLFTVDGKKSHNKSKVKFHSEFILYPHNNGPQFPEIINQNFS